MTPRRKGEILIIMNNNYNKKLLIIFHIKEYVLKIYVHKTCFLCMKTLIQSYIFIWKDKHFNHVRFTANSLQSGS